MKTYFFLLLNIFSSGFLFGQDSIPKSFSVLVSPTNLCVNSKYTLFIEYFPATIESHVDSIEIKNLYLFGDKWINLTTSIDYFVKDTIFDELIETGTHYRIYFKDLLPKVYNVYTFEQPIIVNCPLGHLTFISLDTLCQDRSLNLEYILPKIEDQFDRSNNGTPRNWKWDLSGTNIGNSNLQDPGDIQFLNSGTYNISLTISNQVDTVYASKTITVLDAPIVDRPDYEEIILEPGEEAILQPCGSALIYRWPDITQLSCYDCPSPILMTNEPLDIELLLSGGNALCDTTCRYKIRIHQDDRIFIPNAFSPNDDGYNDNWSVLSPDLEIIEYQIYDRWGGLIWGDKNPFASWDGYSNGKKAEKGVYVYSVRYQRKLNGQLGYLTGSLTLIR